MSKFKAPKKLGVRQNDKYLAPYIIAEIGVNHQGDLSQAKRLIDLAKEGGANCAKFQTYKADTLAIKQSPAYWDTSKEKILSQHELFSLYDKFGPDEYIHLAEHCRENEIDFLSTPFDDQAVDFLDQLQSFYKLASADITNLPLLRRVSGKGKPVLLSTGASNLLEIDIAVNTLKNAGCPDIILLHCVLNYPTDDESANLGMISGLQRVYPKHQIGYSDHTLPDENMTTLTTAFLLGATVIEKHFTHDKTLPGNDHYHAMDVNDLSCFVSQVRKITRLIGYSEFKAPLASENISRLNARRSIVAKHQIPAGKLIEENDLICKRPGTGISPLHWDEIVGQTAVRSIDPDCLIIWEDIRVT